MNDDSTVLVLRLINGDEIIGKISAAMSMIKIVKPAAVVVSHNSSGRSTMSLVDLIPMAKTKEIVIDPRNIMFTYDPDNQVENAYNENFGSGLVVPLKGILTTV